MMKFVVKKLCLALFMSGLSVTVIADDDVKHDNDDDDDIVLCEGFGPQSPRDIDHLGGANKSDFPLAPSYKEMNLCNIHFHKNAEHKARAFSILAPETDDPHHAGGRGYQCAISKNLTKAELKAPDKDVCKGIKTGDTIEVHWVHSTCDVKPGKSLAACSSEACVNPTLRVETQVFTVVNDPSAYDFNKLDYSGSADADGLHQAITLPMDTGAPVEFMGSTTGPKYNAEQCSPLQVTWSVRPQCAKVDINSLGKWCESNEFEEDHGHGIRKLVIEPKLLAPIGQ